MRDITLNQKFKTYFQLCIKWSILISPKYSWTLAPRHEIFIQINCLYNCKQLLRCVPVIGALICMIYVSIGAYASYMLVLHKQSLLAVPNSIRFLLVLEYSGACHSVPGVILVKNKDTIRFSNYRTVGSIRYNTRLGILRH